MKEKIRILVFDCWLPGFLYIQHLADVEGVSLTFVHNSESQMGKPAEEYKDFKARLSPPGWVKDFKSYGKNFRLLFEVVAPDIVLVLSMHYAECRSVLLFAKEYGTLGVFIPHGIFQLDRSTSMVSSPNKLSAIGRLIQKFPRAVYYTNLFWSAHFQRDRARRGSFRQALACFRELLFRYSSWQWSPAQPVRNYYSELVDVAIVYDNSLERYYVQNSGVMFMDTEFIVSGTLDSGKLLRTLHARPSFPQRAEGFTPAAYFVSSPYPDDFSEKGAEILAELLDRLRVVVKAAGFVRFIYRPHPGEPDWFVNRVCELKGIERDTAPGIEGFVAADLICGTSSSLLYNATILSKPVAIVTSKRFQMDVPYYEPLISYPKITLDLDLDAEALVKEHATGLREALLNRFEDFVPTVLDPIEILLEVAKRPSRPLSSDHPQTTCQQY